MADDFRSPPKKIIKIDPKFQKSSKNYRIGYPLGAGTYATVYVAQVFQTRKVVALKKINLRALNSEEKEYCIREVQLLNRINSENVVKCYESFFEKSSMFISLEYADGGDLEKQIERMQQNGRLFSERTIWYFFHQICNGLKDMHQKRIIHRDLKPANIFLTSSGKAKIGDLGFSRLFNGDTRIVTTPCGTEYYKAPERTNTYGYDFKSDIWSLGCMLYQFCTFRSPFEFEAINAYALHKRICSAKYPPFPSKIYSDQLKFFIQRCLSISSDDRPNAEEAHFAAHRMYLSFEQLLVKYKRSQSAAAIVH